MPKQKVECHEKRGLFSGNVFETIKIRFKFQEIWFNK